MSAYVSPVMMDFPWKSLWRIELERRMHEPVKRWVKPVVKPVRLAVPKVQSVAKRTPTVRRPATPKAKPAPLVGTCGHQVYRQRIGKKCSNCVHGRPQGPRADAQWGVCGSCPKRINRGNQSGLCRTCWGKVRPRTWRKA